MGFIYRITNIVTGKMYIGETMEKDPENRWKGHLGAFKRGVGCPALRDAVKKHGVENFRFEVLIICFDEDRFIYEREYIKKYNTIAPHGYNILEGGVGGAGFKGKKHSESVRKRISEASKKWLSEPEVRSKISENTRAFMNSVKVNGIDWGEKVKNSEKFKKAKEEGRIGSSGRPQTEEIRKKISEGVKRHYLKDDAKTRKNLVIEDHRKAMARAKGVQVDQYDLQGNFIASFESFNEAVRVTGVKRGSIQCCISGKYKHGGGFKWKRHDETKIEHIKPT